MAIQIDPVVINDGDPVSAEIIQRMNANIAKVALGEKVTAINIVNTAGTTYAKSANTTISGSFSITALPNSPKSGDVSFSNIAWKEPPAVTLQIMNPNAAGVKQLHGIYLTAVTTTKFNYILIAATGGKSDGCVISWIACGNVDTSAQA
jgi:hypothetical protein